MILTYQISQFTFSRLERVHKACEIAQFAADNLVHRSSASSLRFPRHDSTAFAWRENYFVDKSPCKLVYFLLTMAVEEEPPHTSPSTISMCEGRRSGLTSWSHLSGEQATAEKRSSRRTLSSIQDKKFSPVKRRYIWVPVVCT